MRAGVRNVSSRSRPIPGAAEALHVLSGDGGPGLRVDAVRHGSGRVHDYRPAKRLGEAPLRARGSERMTPRRIPVLSNALGEAGAVGWPGRQVILGDDRQVSARIRAEEGGPK